LGFIANELLDAVEQDHRMDLINDFAYPLPAITGMELLAIPPADREQFGGHLYDIIRTFSDGFSRTLAMHRGETAVGELTEYLGYLLTRRRSRPGQDVLSALAEVPDLSEGERVLVAANIILGLHENVTHAIGLGMNTLLRERPLLQRLRLHP